MMDLITQAGEANEKGHSASMEYTMGICNITKSNLKSSIVTKSEKEGGNGNEEKTCCIYA